MRIDPAGGANAAAGEMRTRRRRADTGFALPTEPEQAEETGAADAPAASTAVSVLTAAELADAAPQADDDDASRQGGEVLNAMAGLQLGLLDGTGLAARESLKTLLRTLPSAADPALDAVLQAIAQRASIELARPD